eukprot:jgi/Chlat1/5448/Chrsp36S05422
MVGLLRDAGMAEDKYGPALYSLHACKTVHLIRHGQAEHNIAGASNSAAFLSWEFEDAKLTPFGWQQADALRQEMASLAEPLNVQLVVVSPMLRTLQTAACVFGQRQADGTGHLLMTPMARPDGTVSPALYANGNFHIMAAELCREHLGLHPCDKRQPISFYRTCFPGVDFSEVQTDEDTWWTEEREPPEALALRAREFINWYACKTNYPSQHLLALHAPGHIALTTKCRLQSRPETRIAVVTHSGFLSTLMATVGDDATGGLQRHFDNCEMRSVVLVNRREAITREAVRESTVVPRLPSGAEAKSPVDMPSSTGVDRMDLPDSSKLAMVDSSRVENGGNASITSALAALISASHPGGLTNAAKQKLGLPASAGTDTASMLVGASAGPGPVSMSNTNSQVTPQHIYVVLDHIRALTASCSKLVEAALPGITTSAVAAAAAAAAAAASQHLHSPHHHQHPEGGVHPLGGAGPSGVEPLSHQHQQQPQQQRLNHGGMSTHSIRPPLDRMRGAGSGMSTGAPAGSPSELDEPHGHAMEASSALPAVIVPPPNADVGMEL